MKKKKKKEMRRKEQGKEIRENGNKRSGGLWC